MLPGGFPSHHFHIVVYLKVLLSKQGCVHRDKGCQSKRKPTFLKGVVCNAYSSILFISKLGVVCKVNISDYFTNSGKQ